MLPTRTKQRHELKFELPPHEALLLAKRLGMLFPRDEHAGPDGRYTVRSLYFDTPFDDALREKHEGFTSRAKWRMRAYGTEARFMAHPARSPKPCDTGPRHTAGAERAA